MGAWVLGGWDGLGDVFGHRGRVRGEGEEGWKVWKESDRNKPVLVVRLEGEAI